MMKPNSGKEAAMAITVTVPVTIDQQRIRRLIRAAQKLKELEHQRDQLRHEIETLLSSGAVVQPGRYFVYLDQVTRRVPAWREAFELRLGREAAEEAEKSFPVRTYRFLRIRDLKTGEVIHG
jgi:hypothetical protein